MKKMEQQTELINAIKTEFYRQTGEVLATDYCGVKIISEEKTMDTTQNNLQSAEPNTEVSLNEEDLAIATEETKTEASKDSNSRELGMDEMGAEWIKNPKVGFETEVLTIVKILENKKIDAKSSDGTAFKTNLSNVDYKIDIHTDKGIYCPTCWEVWGKIKAAVRKNKDLTGAEMAGTKFSVNHKVNGIYAMKPVDEVRKLEEFPNTPEGIAQAEAKVTESKEAQRLKKCYVVTLHLPEGKTVNY